MDSSERVPFLDLRVTDPDERRDLVDAYARVLDHGRMVSGPEVAELESRLAALSGKRLGVGVNTGTDALNLGLQSLGIGPGDEVITTPMSWLASTAAILINGGHAVFADVGMDLNIDPATIESLIGPKTKAILVVHLNGRMCDMPAIMAIAKRYGLLVIEDGSQAFGATIDGTPCGGFGDMACVSLNPMKVLAGTGDAGVVLTDDHAVWDEVDTLRFSGVVDKEYCRVLSHNCRMDTVQAAAILARLDRYGSQVDRRRQIAAHYSDALGSVVETIPEGRRRRDVFYCYQIQCDDRDGLARHLAERGIETKVRHPLVLADQPAFVGRYRGESPAARRAVGRILALPMHDKLSDQQVERVVSAVRQYRNRNAA